MSLFTKIVQKITVFSKIRTKLEGVKNNQIYQRNYSTSDKSSDALVLIAPGAEELETVSIVDVLRRGNVKTVIAGVLSKEPVKCRTETLIIPDCELKQADGLCFSAIILPGGMVNAKILSECEDVGNLLKKQEKKHGIIGAICAAPIVLKKFGIGIGKKLTSYPAVADQLRTSYEYVNCNVVVDNNLITSRGPATALDFSLTLLEEITNKDTARIVADAMLYKPPKYDTRFKQKIVKK